MSIFRLVVNKQKVWDFFKLFTLSLQTRWKGLSMKYIKRESIVWATKKMPKCKVNAYLEIYSIGFIILKFRRFYYFKDSWNNLS